MDEEHLAHPWYGSRQMRRMLRRKGYAVSRHRIRRLMKIMGLYAIYQKPNTSTPHPEHVVYPYLLRGLIIDRPNQVWCTDITYIPMQAGFLYVIAIMDWYSRKVLSWRISNTMEVGFCMEALQDALGKYPAPEIFNTDQGSQFTSQSFTGILKEAGIRVSMDGRGRWMDNVFIERLWRSLKYECVYLQELRSGSAAKREIFKWFEYYNGERPHSSFDGQTPDEVYNHKTSEMMHQAA